MNSGGVDTGHDQVGADVALVSEEVLLQEGHACDDTRLPAGRQGVKLELGGDESGGEFCIRSSTGTGTPNLGRYIVKLLAVLVGNDGTARGSSISGNLVGMSVDHSAPSSKQARERVGRTTTPPSYMQPTMVVPVLVALGRGTPRACKAALRL